MYVCMYVCMYVYMYGFSRLYTSIPHDKLMYVLNEITDFAFKIGPRDYVTVYNSRAF